jgi:hypothetical protein
MMTDVAAIVSPKTRRHYAYEAIDLEAVFDDLSQKMK